MGKRYSLLLFEHMEILQIVHGQRNYKSVLDPNILESIHMMGLQTIHKNVHCEKPCMK